MDFIFLVEEKELSRARKNMRQAEKIIETRKTLDEMQMLNR